MKRIAKILSIVMAVTILSASSVFAFENVTGVFYFTANGQKVTTSSAGLKANDGDNNAYITTLASSNGTVSNVFTRGGTFYARTRLAADLNGVYSPLFTFTSNQKQVRAYESGMARFGQYYKVRAEIENASIGALRVKQCVRWCP